MEDEFRPFKDTFFEISSYSSKIKLHKARPESLDKFVNRLDVLQDEINKFIKAIKE